MFLFVRDPSFLHQLFTSLKKSYTLFWSRLLDGIPEDTEDEIVSTPTNKSQRLLPDPFDSISKSRDYGYSTGKSVGHVTPFGQRGQKFVVRFNIGDAAAPAENGDNNDVENSEDDMIIKKVQTRRRCSLKVNGVGPEPGCRFMYYRTEDRFDSLEKRIVRHADAFAASGLYEEQVDPAVASQVDATLVSKKFNIGV